MFLGAHEDIHKEMYKIIFNFSATEEEKVKLMEVFTPIANKFVSRLEQLVPESGFVLGKETPSIADFIIYDLVIAGEPASLRSMKFDMTPYPKINRLAEEVGKLPGVS